MRLHSWLSSKCDVLPSPKSGYGVFAKESFQSGELVAVWGGVIYTADELQCLGKVFPNFLTHPFEVAEGFYMASTSLTGVDNAERFNHSCDPNIGVKGQIIVVARREIAVGEELVFDYETTDVAPYPFECHCGTPGCRKTIDGSAWKLKSYQDRHEGFLSWFIAEKIKQL